MIGHNGVTAIITNLHLDGILDRILENVVRLLPHDMATIMLLEEEDPGVARVVGRRSNRRRSADDEQKRFRIEDMPTLRYMLREQKPLAIPDTKKYDDWTERRETRWIRSYAGAPIIRSDRNEVIGFLNLDSGRSGFYGNHDIERLLAFANQAAVAIENARLRRRTEDYAASLIVMLDVARELTSAMKDRRQVLETAIKRTVNLVKVMRGAILWYENGKGRVIAAYDPRPGFQQGGIDSEFSNSPLQERIKTGSEYVVILDAATDQQLTDAERRLFLDQGIRSSLILPLIAQGKTIGSLGLDETRSVRRFSETDIRLARILSGLAAVAIDNSRLYQSAEARLSDIIEISQAIVRDALEPNLDVDSFLDRVIYRTLQLMDFNAGWLLLREGDLVKIRATDADHLDDRGRVFPLVDCVSGLVILEGSSRNFHNVERMDEKYRRVYKAPSGGTKAMVSELVVPLQIGDRSLGAFNIESDREAAFEERHVKMLELLSDHVALAIELAQTRKEAEALAQVGLELARETEMSNVLDAVLGHAKRLIQGTFGQVLLILGDALVVRNTTNDPPKDLNNSYLLTNCVSGLAVTERAPIIVADVKKPDYRVVRWLEGDTHRNPKLEDKTTVQPKYQPALEVDKKGMQSEFIVPIFQGSNVVGVVNVETPTDSGFSEGQRSELCTFVASRSERLANALAEADRTALQQMLLEALGLVDTRFGQVLRVDQGYLVIEATTGQEPIGRRELISEAASGIAVEKRLPEYILDVDAEPRYKRYLGSEIKSELVVPLMLRSKVIGVLNMESPVPGFFTTEHARSLQALAEIASVAIDRTERSHGRQMERIGIMAGDIVHRLNNPIGAITSFFDLLKMQPFYEEVAYKNPYFEQFVGNVEEQLSSTKKILRGLREEIREPSVERVSLRDAIREGLRRCQLPPTVSVILRDFPGDAVWVEANDQLADVFSNLFENAREALDSSGTIEISASMLPARARVVVMVKDNGRGIPSEDLPLIFDHDYSTSRRFEEPTHGLGLWLTKAQIESFGGSIRVDSSLGEGTAVMVSMRISPTS